ncbi:tRNA threonylcarbamoyladenosine biosynthesis protein TsaB [hydrothermal vent metagenome]|uniref:N(6)-L-threonylcarbamoyladenine synthase n=1 Tax=hydrothermal vent metagenome TaxID=652676 RepID=A0A3B0ZW20_9ZZZZ
MLILALESTTEACSVALLNDQKPNNAQIVEQFEIAPRQHTKLLLNMVDTLLREQGVSKSDLTAIAFCRGPGAFTGLRITVGVAQGLAFGLNLPLIPVSSLAALAQGGYRHNNHAVFLSCLDARKSEVFWGFYTIEAGFAQLSGEEQVSPLETVGEAVKSFTQTNTTPLQVVGTATPLMQGLNQSVAELGLTFVDSLSDNLNYPHAYDIVFLAAEEYRLGNTVRAEQALPVYLRNNVTY